MEGRRQEVQRERHHRWLRRGLFVVVLLAVAVGAVAASRSSLLDVDRVTVTGNTHTPTAEILRASGIRPGDPLLGLDVGRAKREISALPWIRHAAVERSWRGPIRLVVVEREPAAAAQFGKEWVLIDASGHVLASSKAPGPTTVRIVGLEAGHEGGAQVRGAAPFLRVVELLDPRVRAHGVTIYAVDGEYRIRLRTGGLVRLGEAGHMHAKLRSLTTVLLRVDVRCLRIIDVRVPTVPTVTRDPACAAPSTGSTSAATGSAGGTGTGTGTATPTPPAGQGTPGSVPATTVPTVPTTVARNGPGD